MTNTRTTPFAMSKQEFTEAGHKLISQIAQFFDSISGRTVTTAESPEALQQLLGKTGLPAQGKPADELLSKTTQLLFEHSLLNGHPRFWGYITGSPAPVAALADMLAATVNPNVGANILSPMATEIERQTIKWLATFIGLSPSYGGLLVSGGNMANFTGFLAGRTVKLPEAAKKQGIAALEKKPTIYCSKNTHTWIEKACILFGFGSDAIRWIQLDRHHKMDTASLEAAIEADSKDGCLSVMVIGNAGDVSTGAIDDLNALGAICKKHSLWFHVDGAYGLPAAAVPESKSLFNGLELADSIAIDPHKWMYSPLECGCTLVKDPNHLTQTFSSHPVYYNFDNEPDTLNYYEYGLQNSRGFRSLKIWLMLQQAGKDGYEKMIAEDIALSKLMFSLAEAHPELDAVTQGLSIATFRYKPSVPASISDPGKYLDRLNEKLLNDLQKGGHIFLSNAVVDGKYCLRACIVNFRTTEQDVREAIRLITERGQFIHAQMQAES